MVIWLVRFSLFAAIYIIIIIYRIADRFSTLVSNYYRPPRTYLS